jgi:hypothetical protein
MKRSIITLCFLILMGAGINVQAQKQTKKFSFGFGLEGGILSGDLKEIYSASGGLTLRASYKAGPGFATLTSGLIAYVPKAIESNDPDEDIELKPGYQIPFKAGYKFIFAKHFFLMGELGYSSFTILTPDEYDETKFNKEKQGGFTVAPSVGVNLGAFELGVKYEMISGILDSNLSTIGVRLGFNF